MLAKQSLALEGLKAEQCKALAYPTRIRIVDALRVSDPLGSAG